MKQDKNLPIKVIIPQERDISKNHGMSSDKLFVNITPKFISSITSKFANLGKYYEKIFEVNEKIPTIGKVILREDAVAKSHKPTELFKDLEIIGAEKFEELYIKVTAEGIRRTVARINRPNLSKKMLSNLSTVVDILPISENEKISNIIHNSLYKEKYFKKIKLKIFNFGNDFDDTIVRDNIVLELKKLGYDVSYFEFGKKLNYFKLENVKSEDIIKIAQLNGIKYIDIFQQYSTPEVKEKNITNFFVEPADLIVDDIIIGIIDSGISEISQLNKYVIARESYVPAEYQNREHGTFVASCLEYGSTLDKISEKNKHVFKLLDAIVLPNCDIEKGPIDSLSQDDFYIIIEELMQKYSDKVKIWNLSLGTGQIADKESISDLGVFCDYIQDKYNVQFIISSGNYGENGEQLREWHPQDIVGEKDRITTPADSCRALVVGSISLKDNANTFVRADEPSPFSRRGPGANYLTKPELVDYGGNLLRNKKCDEVGVLGLGLKDDIVESVGTSFSTPKVTYKFAKIYNDLIDKDLMTAKAFLIHNARINSKDVDIETDDINYYGFGQPSYDVENILQCSDNEITLMFKQKVIRGTHLEMLDFPFPKSLIHDGKYTGEIFMTLVYNPFLDQNYGSQYCRTNFDAHFGTYTINSDGEINFKGQVPLEKTWTDLYEKSRIAHGFKWNPVKSYYRNITRGIDITDGWKIRIDMQERDLNQNPEQEFILLVTIRGDEDKAVYTDVVNELNSKSYITQNLQTRYQIQQKIKN